MRLGVGTCLMAKKGADRGDSRGHGIEGWIRVRMDGKKYHVLSSIF